MALGLKSRTCPTGWSGFRRGRERRPRRRATRRLRLEPLEQRQLLAGDGPLLISEFLAANDTTLADQDGEYSDWIEIHNPTTAAVNLDGWYVTDSQADLQKWQFPAVVVPADGYLVVFASGKDRTDPAGELHTDFKLSADGEYLALVQPDGLTVAHEYAPAYPTQFDDVSYGIESTASSETEVLVAEYAAVRVLVPSDDSLGYDWTLPGFDDSAWQAGITGVGYDTATTYDPLLGTDVQAQMYNRRPGVYLRMAFEIADPTAVAALTLRMKYDDGFVAYLNGQPIADALAPVDPTANSYATTNHADSEAVVFQDFDVTSDLDYLNVGTNVLAIHGLNSSLGSSDMLIMPELAAQRIVEQTGTVPGYQLTPTPGEANEPGVQVPGPIIRTATEGPPPPADSDALVITAAVDRALAPIAAVTLNYRIMYLTEVAVPMADNGTGADAKAGDGVFTALIPASASAPGQMVRWRITATDTAGHASVLPRFLYATDSPQYFGTVVEDPTVASQLLVLHWFVQTPAAANTRTGTRASLFYGGEFYDNIKVDLHGQSTSGGNFPKKSYDFDFNKGYRFRYDDDLPRLKDLNLLTNWADKSKVRNTLSYDVYEDAGVPSHLAFPVRVQQNGVFFGTADFVDDGDERLLERTGLDPEGALYKMYDSLVSINYGEKKTRKDEDKSDLQALITGVQLTGASRTNYLFDNIDIPETVNYLAATVLTGNVDMGHKNYYVYRDSEGTGQWQILPWDVDLSFGRRWNATDTYFDDTVFPDTWLFVGSGNKLMGALYNTPAVRAMYVRRVRTLMDELLQPPGTPAEQLKFEARLDQLLALVDPQNDPNPALGSDDADRDYQKWGSWGNLYTMRQAVEELRTAYLPARRNFLYNTQTVGAGGEVPGAQPDLAALPPEQRKVAFGTIEFLPASGNQAEEYLEIINSNTFAVDISGWRLTDAVEFTFAPGTVIPASGTLYVSPDIVAFRARAQSPTGGEGRFVVGGYEGQLSAWGETVRLADAAGNEIVAAAYEGVPTVQQQFLRITEVMYHPPAPTPQEVAAGFADADADAFEYIELTNTGTVPLDLSGVQFTSGIEFTFGSLTLAPGEFIVVVQDQAAFELRYGTEARVAGVFAAGGLSNGGERIELRDAIAEKIQEFTYGDSGDWPGRPDGKGSSLEAIDPAGDDDSEANWRSSTEYGGSPGSAGSGPLLDVVVNEVLSHTDPPHLDAIELYNTTAAGIDIGGWWLSDAEADYQKFQIPAGTFLPAGGYLVFDEEDFNPSGGSDPDDFGLDGAHGDEVWLLAGTAAGRLTRFVDHVTFMAQANGEAWGRWPNGTGELYPMVSQTLGGVADQPRIGAANSGPRVGPVIVSELYYSPPPGGYEFIELHNASRSDVPLYDPLHPADPWRFDGVDFAFPAGTVLPPFSVALLVAADPALFRAAYDVPADVPVFGPYAGALNNGGERLRLLYPDEPPADEPEFAPDLLGDEVRYDNEAPWPVMPDGTGDSLQRVSRTAWGNDAANWYAAPPTPGRVPYNDPPILDPIGNWNVDEGTLLQFTVTASDPDGVPASAVTLSAAGLPPGAMFTPATGAFAWTPGEEQEGQYLVTFTATDHGTPPLSDSETVAITVNEVHFIVSRLTPTRTGFGVDFSHAVQPHVLNLYDGVDGTLGPADVTVLDGAGRAVAGSLVVDDNPRAVAWIAIGDVLAAGTYAITLRSDAAAFRDIEGALLDGDGDGTSGDDFSSLVTIGASTDRVVSTPDFARGAGQGVHIPTTASGLPIRVDNADGITSLAVDLVYDQDLLVITAAALAAGLPGDWSVALDAAIPGVAKITAFGTTPLSGMNAEVVRLTAAVPGNALYGASQAIRLENVSLNGGAIAAVGDVAVHKAVYLGDADGSGIHGSADAFLTVQAALGLASGFAAHAWTDPWIVGDADGSGALSAADAFLIVQEGLGLSEPFVPDNPHIGLTSVGGGVDPQFQIDVNLPGSAGGLVTVPVKLAIEAAASNVGAIEFDLFFDPSKLTIELPGGVSAGADTARVWVISAALLAAGHVRVGMVSSNGQPLAVGLREIARLQFRVGAEQAGRTGWQPGADGLPTRPTLLPPITDYRSPITDLWDGSETHPTWLDIEPVDPRAGGYTWTDADGSLLIRPAQRTLAGAMRERVWREVDAKADLLESVLADLVHAIAPA